jgi:hypothetical protein
MKMRKRRTTGYDLCGGCYSYNCDPATMSRAFNNKVSERRRKNVCVSCGANPCKCKSNNHCSIKLDKNLT